MMTLGHLYMLFINEGKNGFTFGATNNCGIWTAEITGATISRSPNSLWERPSCRFMQAGNTPGSCETVRLRASFAKGANNIHIRMSR